jgi:uncharacterized membrane protein YqaE (UPF0057 family)
MKRIFILFAFALFVQSGFAAIAKTPVVADYATQMPELKNLSPEVMQMGLQKFTEMTPKKYREMTGKRLGIKNTIAMKVAQHKVKNALAGDGADIDKTVYIILAILGWGFLAIGLLTDWEGKDWWMNLLLTCLCWIPGVIHAFIKMKDYYS